MKNKLKPILFSPEMIEAIVNNRKTQTRRICRHQYWSFSELTDFNRNGVDKKSDPNVSSRYQVGDILWIRESWNYNDDLEEPYVYKQKHAEEFLPEYHNRLKWKPSIHMPFEASRIFLKVINVRVERLQNISNEDAIAEGIKPLLMSSQQLIEQGQLYQNYFQNGKFMDGLPSFWSFNSLWCKINGGESWESNPWVFVYEFEILNSVPGTCSVCGCTDKDCKRCIEKTGHACYWENLAETVCSACR